MASTSIVKKIVVIGPESTGKSSLCQRLAEHYRSEWVPEYAREYLLSHGMNYSFDDLLTIAKGQIELEEKYQPAADSQQPAAGSQQPAANSRFTIDDSRFLFIDTDMYVMKVWSEFVFGKCHRFILDQIVHRKYDLYLLCDVDLPWVSDELREYPELETRKELFNMYLDILVNQATPWRIIGGDHEERFLKSRETVNALLK